MSATEVLDEDAARTEVSEVEEDPGLSIFDDDNQDTDGSTTRDVPRLTRWLRRLSHMIVRNVRHVQLVFTRQLCAVRPHVISAWNMYHSRRYVPRHRASSSRRGTYTRNIVVVRDVSEGELPCYPPELISTLTSFIQALHDEQLVLHPSEGNFICS